MSLRGAVEKRTLCEVLREINDILQGNPAHPKVLPKLMEAVLPEISKASQQASGALFLFLLDRSREWFCRSSLSRGSRLTNMEER